MFLVVFGKTTMCKMVVNKTLHVVVEKTKALPSYIMKDNLDLPSILSIILLLVNSCAYHIIVISNMYFDGAVKFMLSSYI